MVVSHTARAASSRCATAWALGAPCTPSSTKNRRGPPRGRARPLTLTPLPLTPLLLTLRSARLRSARLRSARLRSAIEGSPRLTLSSRPTGTKPRATREVAEGGVLLGSPSRPAVPMLTSEASVLADDQPRSSTQRDRSKPTREQSSMAASPASSSNCNEANDKGGSSAPSNSSSSPSSSSLLPPMPVTPLLPLGGGALTVR